MYNETNCPKLKRDAVIIINLVYRISIAQFQYRKPHEIDILQLEQR